MKRLFPFLLLTAAAYAQPSNVVSVTFLDPTGTACVAGTGVIYAITGGFFTCQSGVFALVSGGSSSGTVTNTAGALTSSNVVIGNAANDVKVSSSVFIDPVTGVNSANGFVSAGTTSGCWHGGGITSGNLVDLCVQDSTTAWTFKLPNAPAAAHQFFTTDTGGVGSFVQPAVTDIVATGTPGSTTALFGDGSWKAVTGPVYRYKTTLVNAGSAIAAGVTGYNTVAATCTVQSWNIQVDQGTVSFDVWRVATGTALPTVAATQLTGGYLSLTTGTNLHSTTLTRFNTGNTAWTANDVLGFNLKTIDSGTPTMAVLEILCQ